MNRWFVTGTGTGVGKTGITRGLALAARRRGIAALALKPVETGVDDLALDADALALAAGRSALDGPWVRRRAPVAPYAAELLGEPAVELAPLVAAIDDASRGVELVLIEGAGGLLVPLTATASIADLALTLVAPVLLVVPNQLGCLSHALTALESAERRGLPVRALVLVDVPSPDASSTTNARILRERASCPVLSVSHVGPTPTDDRLADAVELAGLAALVLPRSV